MATKGWGTPQPTYRMKGTNIMITKRNELMQEVETYGNGLLSDETIERTVDIIMECDPVPDHIDAISIDSIIQAVEDHGAVHLSDVFELEYDPDEIDWYIPMDGLSDIYLHIGDVNGDDAASYAVRYLGDMDWKIKYRVVYSNGTVEYYALCCSALERAFRIERETGRSASVDQVALCRNEHGIVTDEYVIHRIIYHRII